MVVAWAVFSLLERWATNIFLKFWDAETHGLCQQRKSNQLKLFTLVLPCCSLQGSLRKGSSRRHRWTDTEESLRVCKTLQLPVNPRRLVKESQGKPQEGSYCCVSVTTEWSWWRCESDCECKAGDGRKPSSKMFFLAIYDAFGEPFQLGQVHVKMLSVAVIFQAEMLRKCIQGKNLDGWEGWLLPVLSIPSVLEVLLTTGVAWLLVYSGEEFCARVRVLSSDSLSSVSGCEEEHSKGKDQSPVSVEEQSQPAQNQPSALLSDRAVEFIVLLSW